MSLFYACLLYFVLLHAEPTLAQTTVTVKQGDINGKISILGPNVTSYLGIPYAEPPLGNLRFKKPVPKAAWSSPLNATEYGPICLQRNATFPSSEDCLTLNVHVPQNNNTGPKAVMVWVHGGGFVVGSARVLDPVVLALEDVIVVSINYRLGIFGFLAVGDVAKGNYGLWDQHLAFRWIKENIAAFEGDPNRITIFGESAGSMSVSFHAMSPMSDELFHRVISQSGVGSQDFVLLQSSKNIALLSETSKCNSTDSVSLVSCLKNKSEQDLLEASNILAETLFWIPNMDNELITGYVESSINFLPDQYRKLDFLMGSNSLDGNFDTQALAKAEDGFTESDFSKAVDNLLHAFVRLDRDVIKAALLQEYTAGVLNPDNRTRVKQLVEMEGDLFFTVPTHLNALKHDTANGTGSTFVYYFSINTCFKVLPTASWLDGAGHVDELIYINGMISSVCNGSATPADLALQTAMITYWTNFAKSG
ncbi:neuroligin-4, Y-linked-like [Lingula anatina]|uniref:Neuroligin-4, Y-linked-like n=1 Tax=Lingula anatina TaxID=7574 RepID=A0A1S3HNY5_LINAN|nr:neuroligin-4, Y-linked-like [Lingula anatina]|eukprot:XP_013386749.2 neuroligin-4, Y-linked-like [Lingula anatina]